MTERQRVRRLEEVVAELTKAMLLLEAEVAQLKKKRVVKKKS